MNWKAQAPKRPWLPAPWRGFVGGKGRTLMDERCGKRGGWGGWGMREWGIFFLRKKVKLNQVSWWFYMMYPDKKCQLRIGPYLYTFFLEYHDSRLNLGHKHEGQDAHTVFFLEGQNFIPWTFWGRPGETRVVHVEVGLFLLKISPLIQDKPWKKSLDPTTFLVVKVWRIPFLQKGNMHFPGKLLWLRSQQKHPDLAAGLWEMIAKITPTKTKMSLKMGPFQKVSSLPTTIFQGTC